ncbi:MAG: peptide deformylase [Planctomycetota bacterium]|nr:MAG: peptide deformylase [Planctomycetota bacterium]
MQIVLFPHPALRFPSVEVQRIDDALRSAVQKMFALMYESKGVGLAANQVGLPFRFFVVNPSGDPEKKEEEEVFINPIISSRRGMEFHEEGCLSLPKIYSDVERPLEITIDAFDLNGQSRKRKIKGFLARVIQHEYDHIEGFLFTDRIEADQHDEIYEDILLVAEQFRKQQAEGLYDGDEGIEKELAVMAANGRVPAGFSTTKKPTPAPNAE